MPDKSSSAGDKPVDNVDKSASDGPGSSTRTPSEPPKGSDIARAALESARAARRAVPPQSSQRAGTRRRRGWSGPRPDDRDPQLLGRLASRIAADRGWGDRLSSGVVFARWAQLVGPDIAEHSQPVSLNDGELLVRASSTAWATQLRLLQRQLISRITAGAGPGIVTRLRIQGPAAPTWVHGPRHIRGRGPRDTYG
ncbi:MAG TPA: DciA family protein [Pseudonocardiaceae bacterium]|nr:DciA family protein [Pseudonocardiaceae bacterium]